MSISTFKGELVAGTIKADFSADFSNEGSALLQMSYAESGGGNPQLSHDIAQPGLAAHTSLTVSKKGILEVWVVAGADEDSGRLVVSSNGTEKDADNIQGSVRWS